MCSKLFLAMRTVHHLDNFWNSTKVTQLHGASRNKQFKQLHWPPHAPIAKGVNKPCRFWLPMAETLSAQMLVLCFDPLKKIEKYLKY